MRDDVTRSCDLEYNNTHTHTKTLQEETLCQLHFLSVSKPFPTLPASLYESPSKLPNQNWPPPKQFGSFPAGLSLFVMHILLHGFPSEPPPDMQESPKERASAFGQRLPSKHWIKSASRQSPIEKGHCIKHVIMEGMYNWYFFVSDMPSKNLVPLSKVLNVEWF